MRLWIQLLLRPHFSSVFFIFQKHTSKVSPGMSGWSCNGGAKGQHAGYYSALRGGPQSQDMSWRICNLSQRVILLHVLYYLEMAEMEPGQTVLPKITVFQIRKSLACHKPTCKHTHRENPIVTNTSAGCSAHAGHKLCFDRRYTLLSWKNQALRCLSEYLNSNLWCAT